MRRSTPIAKAFSLVELLVALGIIAVLASLLTGTYMQAKSTARGTNSTSNLRQIVTSLLIYEQNEGEIPHFSSAQSNIPKSITFDSLDYWRPNASVQFGAPLLGSYGYIRGVDGYRTYEEWREYLGDVENPALVASLWSNSWKLAAFEGMRPPTKACHSVDARICLFPDRIRFGRYDGSVVLWKGKKFSQGSNYGFGWRLSWINVFHPELQN